MTSYGVGDYVDDDGGDDDGGDDNDGGAMMVATTLCTCEFLILYESYVGMLEPLKTYILTRMEKLSLLICLNK